MSQTSMSTSMPLTHLLVADALRARLGKQWRRGERLPPVNELATQLEAGQRSTLRAVQLLVQQGLLVSRQRMGTFVSDRYDNHQLQLMQSGPSHAGNEPTAFRLDGKTIRIVPAACATDRHFGDMHQALRGQLLTCGANIIDAPRESATRDFPSTAVNDLRRHARKEGGSAIVFINPDEGSPLQLLARQTMVAITAFGQMQVIGSDRYDVVAADEVQAGQLAAERLRAAGCKRPCFIGVGATRDSEDFDGPSRARFRAFADAWGEPVPHRLTARNYSDDAAARLLPVFKEMKPAPDGIFCSADELAIGFVTGSLAVGLEAGRDYQIIGFDGQERGQTFAAGPLTTVKVPSREMGIRASELLAKRLLGDDAPPQRVYLGCRLLEGVTTK